MKILVVSDSHGDLTSLHEVLLKEKGIDCYLHAGDVGLSPEEIAPFKAVKGNCDYPFKGLPPELKVKTPYGLLLMRHYPLFDESQADYLYQNGFRIFIHGHTHYKEEKVVRRLHVYCPGSLSYPRDDGPSYLILDIDKDKCAATFKRLI